MDCYICIDENRLIWGLFQSEKEAQLYVDIINQDPKIDTIVKVRKYGLIPEGIGEEFIKEAAQAMIEEHNKD